MTSRVWVVVLAVAVGRADVRTDAAEPAGELPPEVRADAVRAVAESARTDDEKLAALHLRQARHPGVFSWPLHNELRHLYAERDERASMGQCDIILAHIPDDNYILSILSDWQLGKDPEAAARALEDKARRFPDLRHLSAACRLTARSLRGGMAGRTTP